MKKLIVILFFCLLALSLFPQERRHEVTVLNVSVSVRVLEGSQFIDNLTKDDFELYEDGKLQNIEALYLINKKNIVRQEALRGYYPSLARHYYLLFQITNYNPKFNDAIEYFIHNIIQPALYHSMTIRVVGPGITEVGNPWHARRTLYLQASKMDRHRLTKGDQNVARGDLT